MRKHARLKKQGFLKKELKRADPIETTGKHLTKLEQQVADSLETSKIEVHKVYAPDFLVINKKTRRFCFVEVKNRHDRPNYLQSKSFKKFRMAGLPVVVVYPNHPKRKRYLSKVLKAMIKLKRKP